MRPWVHLSVLAVLMAAGCAKDNDDKPAGKGAGDAQEALGPAKPGVTLDAGQQERLGIRTEWPAAAQWQPGMEATGRAANPLTFAAAVADLETARAAATASQADLERTRTLAAQDNASPRVLEAAQAAAARDALAVAAAQAKFAADWGLRLAGQTNLTEVAARLRTNDYSLIKVFLPVGVFPNPPPDRATVYSFGAGSEAVAAEYADDLHIDPTTQVQTLLFSAAAKVPAEMAVTVHLKTAGEPEGGVVVPAGAVVRYEGQGWVYVQADTNQFVRVAVPLDRLLTNGWFVGADVSATNRMVVDGAQAVLSAELSGRGFTTGERD
jgi:hypothetical protein